MPHRLKDDESCHSVAQAGLWSSLLEQLHTISCCILQQTLMSLISANMTHACHTILYDWNQWTAEQNGTVEDTLSRIGAADIKHCLQKWFRQLMAHFDMHQDFHSVYPWDVCNQHFLIFGSYLLLWLSGRSYSFKFGFTSCCWWYML